ncbi:MAG: LysR family transcriptional regulator [Pseudomonadota bacterium]
MENTNIYRLDGHTLKVFVSVYDTLSVSRTADAFNLNQSTISHTLDRLRAALDDPLFVRVGRGIIATERAAALAEPVRKILVELDGLKRDQSLAVKLDERPVAIACNVTETLPVLSDMRDRLRAQHPKVQTRFLELGSRENLEPLLSDGSADLAVSVHMPLYPASLAASPLAMDDLKVYYDPDCRGPITSVEDYCRAQHAALDFGGSRKSNVAVALEAQSLTRTVALAVANVHVLGKMIKGTDLIATMQGSLAHHAFADLAVCDPPIILPKVRFDMVWHRREDASPRNLWLRQQMAEAFAAQQGTTGLEPPKPAHHRPTGTG